MADQIADHHCRITLVYNKYKYVSFQGEHFVCEKLALMKLVFCLQASLLKLFKNEFVPSPFFLSPSDPSPSKKQTKKATEG